MAAAGRQLLLAGLGEEQLEQLRPEGPATLLEELRPLASLQLGRYRVTAVHTKDKNPVRSVGLVVCDGIKVGQSMDIRASDGMVEIGIEDWQQSFGMYYEGKLSQSDDEVAGGGEDHDGLHFVKTESVLDLRKSGEVTVTTTTTYQESGEVMEVMEVARACWWE